MTCQTSQLINKVLHEMHACSKRMIKEIPNDSPRVWILWIRVPKHRKPLGIYFIKLTSSCLRQELQLCFIGFKTRSDSRVF